MAEYWHIDLSEVRGLRGWYKKQPRRMQIASAWMLNEFAVGTREEAIRHIGRVMIVRNPKFVSGNLRFTKTSTSLPINQQRSIAGSITRDRFSGWVEQEKGKATDRKRYATIAGRGGDKKKQIRPSVRLKKNNEVVSISDLHPSGRSTNYGGAIAMMLRRKDSRLLAMKVGGKLLLLKRNRNKMEHVQTLRPKQPKQIPWLRQARAIYFKNNPPQRTWNRVVDRVMQPPPKK